MRRPAAVGVAAVGALVCVLAGGLAGSAAATAGTTRAAFTSSVELPFGQVGAAVEVVPEPPAARSAVPGTAAEPTAAAEPTPTPTPTRDHAVPPPSSPSSPVAELHDHDEVEPEVDTGAERGAATAPTSSAPEETAPGP